MYVRLAVPFAVLVSLASSAWSQPPAVTPKLSPAESVQLYAAAGFRMGNGAVVSTICSQPSMPRVTYVDLNGDGGAEAVVVDKNPACYGQPGDWFTVVRREPNGKWRPILRNVGVVTWEPTRTQGWVDARLSGGGQCDRLARFDGSDYRQTSDCVAPGGQAAPGRPAASAPAANNLTVAERAAIFKAAGFTQRGDDWVGCEGNSTASIEKDDVRDLNGDGKLEAIITEQGSACYGNTGQGFYLMTQTGPAWKVMYSSPGMPEFLATKANGWPELEVGGPGFCFPIERWDGKTYVFHRNHEYDPGACARR
jgi:hypothetical protein